MNDKDSIDVLENVLKTSMEMCGEDYDCDDCPCRNNDEGDCLLEHIKAAVEALKFREEQQGALW